MHNDLIIVDIHPGMGKYINKQTVMDDYFNIHIY
jgi:hypothetical protein